MRLAGLKQIREVMKSPELKMVKAVDTRWLSNKAAVSALLRCLPAVLLMTQVCSKTHYCEHLTHSAGSFGATCPTEDSTCCLLYTSDAADE